MKNRSQTLLSISLALVGCFGCSGDEGPPPELGGGAASPGGSGNVAGAGSGGTGGVPSAGQGGSQSKGGSGAGLAGSGAGAGAGAAGRAAGGRGGSQAGAGGSGQSGGSGGAGVGGAGVGGAGAGGLGGASAGGMNGAGMGPVSDAPPDLYAYYCSGCHGVQGAGMETYGPETQHPVHDYSLWVVRNGLPGEGYRDPMEPLEASVLSDAALESIFDWLDEPPQPTTGEGLYLDYCGNCHGADGKGGPTMRPILQELAEIEPLVRQGAHLGEFAMRREYMPAWNTMQLSDAEVDLIYAYVESL